MRGGRKTRGSVSKRCKECDEYIQGACEGVADDTCLQDDAAQSTPEQEEEEEE